MNKSKNLSKKIISLMVAFVLIFSFVGPTITLAAEEKSVNYSVKVRVEGNNSTFITPTNVNITTLDLSDYPGIEKDASSYDSLKPIHAIVKALEVGGIYPKNKNDFEIGSGGNYITGVKGLREFGKGPYSGWKYYVDNKYAPAGVGDFKINNGQEIVLFYVENFIENIYSFFDKDSVEAEQGQAFNLKLYGETKTNTVEGASVLIDDKPYKKDGQPVTTDADGNVSLSIEKAGTYHISARMENSQGENILSRPYAKVVVKEKSTPINTIKKIEDVDGFEVEFNTKESEVISSLPETGYIVDSLDGRHQVSLDWLIENYSPDKSGIYQAVADFTLPQGVVQTSPETNLQVKTKILVKEEKVEVPEKPEEEPEKPEKPAEESIDISSMLNKTVNFYKENNPENPMSDWEAFVGLWASGNTLAREYDWEIENQDFAENISTNHALNYSYSLLAQGKDPSDIWGGRNLFKELASQQRENGLFTNIGKHVFSMLLLDAGVEMGADVGDWNDEKRQIALDALINIQNEDGSFETFSHLDHTAFALIELAKHKGQSDVDRSIEKALGFLKSKQTDSGGFDYNEGFEKGENSNSLSVIIQGLVALGEDVLDKDGKWSKNGKTPVHALRDYQKDDGSFLWKKDLTISGPATKQALVALNDLDKGTSTWIDFGKGFDLSGENDNNEGSIEDEDKEDNNSQVDLNGALEKVIGYYEKHLPEDPNNDWEIYVGLWGTGNIVEKDYNWEITDPGIKEDTKGNETLRYGFSLLAKGKDPSNVWEGRNLFKELASQQNEDGSFTTLGKQIFSIIFLDAGMELGVDVGSWNSKKAEKAIDNLIKKQNDDGSFGDFSRLDYTGWSLIVLSEYKGQENVDKAIGKALDFLKGKQTDKASFVDGSGWGQAENANSIAAVIQGLVALGEDVTGSKGKWSKNGKTPLDALLKYQQEDGSFWWEEDNKGDVNMATKQSLVALTDLKNGKSTWLRLGEEIDFSKGEPVAKEKIEEIILHISQLPKEDKITFNDKMVILKVYNEYMKLSPKDKEKIENSSVLLRAKIRVEEIEKTIDEINKGIWDLPGKVSQITLDHKEAVFTLIKMYNSLSQEDKEHIEYVDELLSYKEKIDSLLKEEGLEEDKSEEDESENSSKDEAIGGNENAGTGEDENSYVPGQADGSNNSGSSSGGFENSPKTGDKGILVPIIFFAISLLTIFFLRKKEKAS